ncbi:MAG: ABC transporter ATP-binding protein [Bacteroidales bacterium]|jgi:ABC-type Fe3+/spermidine/putrescine transport system ATPase subunit|nr:ABC transporter ATP-binding protein [Bacteroidales bacterium]MDD4618019.1 ABC transporter ATP-binding protein [Bacteroidales bacterium]
MLQINQLEYTIGNFSFGPFSIRLEQGDYLAVFGPSGSGKSLFLEMMAGIRTPHKGSIHISGTEITHLPSRKRPVSLLFQDYALFPHMNVKENISFPLKIRKETKEKTERKVYELCQYLSIEHLLSREIEGLSGGEKQRVALARAIAPNPKLLLLDEPLSALDTALREEAMELLKLIKTSGITIIHVTHNQEEVKDIANKIITFPQNIKT